MSFTEKQVSQLSAKLDPAHIRPPQQYGPKGDYLEGWHVIAEANRIFGFDAWSYEVAETRCVSESARKIGRQQKDGWGVTYTAKVRVVVQGIVREDFGAGHGYDVDAGLAHESAVKEAVTDALKRALRTFGNVFGLALYDKTRANVETPEAANKPAQLSKEKARPIFSTLQDDMRLNKSQADLERWLKDADVNELRAQLPEDWNKELRRMAKEYWDSLPKETRPEDQPSMMAG